MKGNKSINAKGACVQATTIKKTASVFIISISRACGMGLCNCHSRQYKYIRSYQVNNTEKIREVESEF